VREPSQTKQARWTRRKWATDEKFRQTTRENHAKWIRAKRESDPEFAERQRASSREWKRRNRARTRAYDRARAVKAPLPGPSPFHLRGGGDA